MTTAHGVTAPAFDLPGVDGRNHTLDEYADTPVLVLVQYCNHCPYAQAWEGRVNQVQRDYADRGVRLVAISSNDADAYPEDSLEEMRKRAERETLSFDYLYDEDQSVARALGSSRTPEVFLYDAERRLVYHGAVDDSRDETEVSQHYLRDALDAVLAGHNPPVPETPAVGCTVKWKPA